MSYQSATGKASPEFVHAPVHPPTTTNEGNKRKQQSEQRRQLLSCTKCRERKVKCDRTKPCSACCARGAPKDCKFLADEGDYAPIQQSYELRKLRQENIRLRERLRAGKLSIDGNDENHGDSSETRFGDGPASRSHKKRSIRQKRFQGAEWSDSIYFGSPGLANVVNEFASINLTPTTQSLAYLLPRGADMYARRDPQPYPFATLFKPTPEACIPQLLEFLPSNDELFIILGYFEKRVCMCSFPNVPIEITRDEVERFLPEADNNERFKNAVTYPDTLALLFAALALGVQNSVWDRCGERWVTGAMDKEVQKGDVYIAAAKQALRMACFTSKPTLLGIQALIMIGPYLTNSGRFLDAWTLFGTTIRLAQSIGLHRHPKYLDPAPPTSRECHIRQQLWWWMLHMDQQYSMTLGRPLGISGMGDCPQPHETTISPTHLRFSDCVQRFTVYARQILSSDRLSNAKIDEFTDGLRNLLDTMPDVLRFNETWLDKKVEIPEWPLDIMAAAFYCQTHTYLILLNRQRLDKQLPVDNSPTMLQSEVGAAQSSLPAVNGLGNGQRSSKPPMQSTLRGRPLVLSSSQHLLSAFLFYYARVPAALICWTMGQQAFNSSMILILDALETGNLSRIGKVEEAYAVFVELQKKGVHKLADMAVDRISWGISELNRRGANSGAGVDVKSERLDTQVDRPCKMKSQDARENDATRKSDTLHDTVMGNTGMLLLEDPGLQAFVPEAFAPIKWAMPTIDKANARAMKLDLHLEDQQEQGKYSQDEDMDFEGSSQQYHEYQHARSSEQLQGTHLSDPGSAKLRYPTIDAAPRYGEIPPQGLTSPTASSRIVTSAQQFQLQFQGLTPTLDHISTPHFRHHSYPSLQPSAITSLAVPLALTLSEQQNLSSASNPTQSLTSPLLQQQAGNVLSQGTLQALSEEMHCRPPYSVDNSNVHPSWAARPAALISSVSEPVLRFSHASSQSQTFPDHAQRMTEQTHSTAYQYAFPLPGDTGDNIRSNATGFAGTLEECEQTGIWSRWVGSSGAG